MDERDPKTPGDENEKALPDVEGHRLVDRAAGENEEPGDETPDVEGHQLKPPGKVVNP